MIALTKVMHKLFLTHCELDEPRMVTARVCEECPEGTVIDRRSKVICGGQIKFFVAPCFHNLKSSATVEDCEKCEYGEVGEDRLRAFCSEF